MTVTANAGQSKTYGEADPVFTFSTTSLGSGIPVAGALTRVAGETVLEVGPGPGGLTRAILAGDVARLIAVDADPRSIAALRPLEEQQAGRLRLIEGDALELDPASLGTERLTVIANLPWILTPAFFVVLAILMFNFVGDGLRDAADPYASR